MVGLQVVVLRLPPLRTLKESSPGWEETLQVVLLVHFRVLLLPRMDCLRILPRKVVLRVLHFHRKDFLRVLHGRIHLILLMCFLLLDSTLVP